MSDREQEREPSEETVALIRAAYAAFNRGDAEATLRYLSPDVTWQQRREHPSGGTHEGRDAIEHNVLESIHEQFEDYTIEPVEIFDRGTHAVIVAHQSGRGRMSGVPVEGTIVHVVRLEQGRATGLRAFETTEEAWAYLDSLDPAADDDRADS